MREKELRGEKLFQYLISKKDDYSQTVTLLNYHDNIEKAYSVLERSVDEGKRLVAVYPGEGEIVVSDMEYICDIEDGALYLQ